MVFVIGVEELECNKGIILKPKIISAMCSSESIEWGTPQDLFDNLNAEFHFTLDPCSNSLNYKCAKHYTKADDGLSKNWNGETVFMNPPYGREIDDWVAKAYAESRRDNTIVVALLPSRTDTRWWHQYCMFNEVRFIRGRISFTRGSRLGDAPALFPSAIVVFRKGLNPKMVSY
jgi:site-specific DNA-methyltransferase (adenine-specific)